nr:GrpB family protein [Paenibacillus yonginensis]
MRGHPEDCLRYEAEKRRLMNLYPLDRIKYVEGKGTMVWDILRQAHLWSQETGWKPGEADL